MNKNYPFENILKCNSRFYIQGGKEQGKLRNVGQEKSCVNRDSVTILLPFLIDGCVINLLGEALYFRGLPQRNSGNGVE